MSCSRWPDFADAEALDELGIEDPFELTGLYQGVDLAHRSVLDPAPAVSMVFLYRRPILDEWAERGDVTLGALIAHVLTHEIGHHFGLDAGRRHRGDRSTAKAMAERTRLRESQNRDAPVIFLDDRIGAGHFASSRRLGGAMLRRPKREWSR